MTTKHEFNVPQTLILFNYLHLISGEPQFKISSYHYHPRVVPQLHTGTSISRYTILTPNTKTRSTNKTDNYFQDLYDVNHLDTPLLLYPIRCATISTIPR